MDALALLCNLYGDGPATLGRLRSAGCDSFERLERMDPRELAEVLGTPEAAARRFLREARILVDRFETHTLEEEERPPLAKASAASEPPLESPAASKDDEIDNAAAPLIDRVLQRWRERDAAVGAEHDVEFSEVDEAVSTSQLAAELRTLGTPLRPRIVDGLDRTWCERLQKASVTTVEQLAETDALPLSRETGAGLTHVMRLQFLARRLLSERGVVETPEPPDVLRPVGRPGPPRGPSPESSPVPSPKFSASESPFGVAATALTRELDGPAREPESPEPPAPSEGAAGPFA